MVDICILPSILNIVALLIRLGTVPVRSPKRNYLLLCTWVLANLQMLLHSQHCPPITGDNDILHENSVIVFRFFSFSFFLKIDFWLGIMNSNSATSVRLQTCLLYTFSGGYSWRAVLSMPAPSSRCHIWRLSTVNNENTRVAARRRIASWNTQIRDCPINSNLNKWTGIVYLERELERIIHVSSFVQSTAPVISCLTRSNTL